MDTEALIRQAIHRKQIVVATYHGFVREFCPHALGSKRRRRHVLAFQFAGDSQRGLPAEGAWRCFQVDLLQDVALRSGPWRSAANVFNPQSCLDSIDVVVQPFPRRRRTRRPPRAVIGAGHGRGRSAPPRPEGTTP
jgi:hypothetical protein